MDVDRQASAAATPSRVEQTILGSPSHTFDGSVNQWCNYRGPFGTKCGKRESDPIHDLEFEREDAEVRALAEEDDHAVA